MPTTVDTSMLPQLPAAQPFLLGSEYPAATSVEPTPAPPAIDNLRKVAVLLIVLGEEAGSQIVKQLGPEEVKRVGKAVGLASAIGPGEATEVLREFQQLVMARSCVVKGGMEYASRMLQGAFGNDRARRLLDQVSQAIGSEQSSFDSLQQAEPRYLANLVHSEHPQTIALILSHLNPWQAAALIATLPPETRSELAMRMASIEQISPEVVNKISQVINEKMQGLGDLSRRAYGGPRAVAEMLNRLDAGIRNEMLAQIEEQDGKLGGSIRDLMFVFEDLLSVDGEGMKTILANADPRTLAVALKGSNEKLRAHFFANLSSTGAQMLREDIDGIGPVRLRDVEAAQQQILASARELEAKGALKLSNDGEAYVS